ncbi:hypothetical protein EZI54_07385 [Marinobacter halodurans]|uniref:RES domain-containing protein n=1 Tax=Marinobacter halodurans TaxID=2528979 RepID=A0ABY1ZMT9_9GAMM|nr:hypothetical protein [Marinobacter halodurans]TBW57474.1 hypothetical protein EZI54_07385 [Marinobacter halodurans]
MEQKPPASLVALKTFFTYKGQRPPEEVVISQADFSLDSNTTLPTCGQTLLYGTRRTQGVLGRALMQAHERDEELCIVDVKVNVGQWVNRKQSFDTFDLLHFLKVPDRAKQAVLDDIAEHWKRLLALRGLPQDDFPRKASPHMELLDELIKIEPYNKLNVIGFPIQTTTGWTQAAVVTNPDAIVEITPITMFDTRVKLAGME